MQYIHKWNLVLGTVVVAVLGNIGPAQQSARAQNSLAGWADREYKVREPAKTIPSRIRTSQDRNLKDGTFPNAEEEQDFATYYEKVWFPLITDKASRQPKEGQPSKDVVAKLRADLAVCAKAQNHQVYNKLGALILEYMAEVAGNNDFHPAARENALLAIGEVNSPEAAKLLLDTAFGAGQPFAFRPVAMAGLVRMAGKGVLTDPALAALVVPKMVACANKNVKNDGISWMRGQAADVLGDMGNTQKEVLSALLNMLDDKALLIPLRSKAARALGKLDYGTSPPPAGPYLKALAELADDALSSDQPADRGRVRSVIRDVESARKKFAPSTAAETKLSTGLEKILQTLDTDTVKPMNTVELKTAIATAKEALDDLLKK